MTNMTLEQYEEIRDGLLQRKEMAYKDYIEAANRYSITHKTRDYEEVQRAEIALNDCLTDLLNHSNNSPA